MSGCNKKEQTSQYIEVSPNTEIVFDINLIKNKSFIDVENLLKEKAKLERTTDFGTYIQKIYKYPNNKIEITYSFSKEHKGEYIQDLISYYPSNNIVCDSQTPAKMGINSNNSNINPAEYDSSVGRTEWVIFDKKTEQYIGTFSCVGDNSAAIMIYFE